LLNFFQVLPLCLFTAALGITKILSPLHETTRKPNRKGLIWSHAEEMLEFSDESPVLGGVNFCSGPVATQAQPFLYGHLGMVAPLHPANLHDLSGVLCLAYSDVSTF
jgi:hypothetical protein